MPSSTFQAMLPSVGSLMTGQGEMKPQNVGLLFLAMICMLAPLDISQLCFGLIGALAYATLQAFAPRQGKTNCQLAAEREQRQRESSAHDAPQRSPMKGGVRSRTGTGTPPRKPSLVSTPVKQEVYKPSSVPVTAPKFASIGWEAEVCELIPQLAPGVTENQAVHRLALHVKKTIQAIFPDVEVTGFAHGSLTCGRAFGVAVPEVDIVANISPDALAQRLQQRGRHLDMKKLHKTAIRTCTDQLVSAGGFKFRRSAFRGEEPRVTLLVPVNLGIFTEAVPVDFSINAVTPFYTAALLTECGQIEPRAKALILLVKRWAKDRGICHAAKGHLSPYLWSLLVMYFMQVGVDDEGALLPTLDAFKMSSHLMTSRNGKSKGKAAALPPSDKLEKLSIGQLFCKFVQFYSQHYNWSNESISVRSGKRAPPGLALPVHIVVRDDGTTLVAPTIEDPFQSGSNLGTCMNALSLDRLHAELNRASELCMRSASLTEMLEPWVPAEDAPKPRSGSSSHDEKDA